MRKNKILVFVFYVLIPLRAGLCIDADQAQAFSGNDLHINGRSVLIQQETTGEHIIVVEDGFSISICGNDYSSTQGVVWLKSETVEYRGNVSVDYSAKVYLTGDVSVRRSGSFRGVNIRQADVEDGKGRFLQFDVTGDVYVDATEKKQGDPRKTSLYKKALASDVTFGPVFVVQPQALVPRIVGDRAVANKKESKKSWFKKDWFGFAKNKKKTITDSNDQQLSGQEVVYVDDIEQPVPEEKIKFTYPVNIAPAGDKPLSLEKQDYQDGDSIAVVTDRFYIWQRQQSGGLTELEADSAVIFYSAGIGRDSNSDDTSADVVRGVYMAGDVLLTKGTRTLRCDEMYYDFIDHKALAINAEIRSFDSGRGIPIYVRADKIRQVAENKFTAEDVTVTTSEFYKPQVSLTMDSIMLTDSTAVDEETGQLSDSSYDAEMRKVRMKLGKRTVFYWPKIRSNLQQPDIPIKSVRISQDSEWGTSVETRWYLARLLGLREPKGVESTYALDYYGDRGVGTGIEIDYEREDYYGNLLTYIIHDSGEDRLGRNETRRNLEPKDKLRGRFSWLHRHFLPYEWQLTTAFNYASDEHFIEGYYRNEFNVGTQESYIHLKRIEDNRAVSILAKYRINDFSDELEELPTVEHHIIGQSLFDNKVTFYGDSQVSNLRQRIGDDHTTRISQDNFLFGYHRSELDMPLTSGVFKVVPFTAATVGYDGRSGFRRSAVDGTDSGLSGDDQVAIGEAGIRIYPRPLWKVYPDIKSRLWDIEKIRHVISPELTAIMYAESSKDVEQRDVLYMAIDQRLQTKRGPEDKKRTVDWMRLNTEVAFVSNADNKESGPDWFTWGKPFVPMRVFSAPGIFNGDFIQDSLRRIETFGPRRSYFGSEYVWRISDTSMLLSDMHFDIKSKQVDQYNIGISRLVWPNLSYYIGSRYLKRTSVLGEKGSNSFTAAITYVLDPRYTLIFAQQFDFDYGANIRSDITLLRKYHRMCYGFTYSADSSLDTQAIVISIWPQGVKEFAMGQRRYVGMGGAGGY